MDTPDAPVPIPGPFTVPSPFQIVPLPHDDFGPRLNAILWGLVGLSAVFLGLRMYCKFQRHKGLWWDDAFLIAAWICLVTQTGLTSGTIALGYGRHVWDIPPRNFPEMILLTNVGATFSILSAVWSKTSFAVTLLRLLRSTTGWMKPVVWTIIISMNAVMGIGALFLWIQCTPIQRSWDPNVEGTCRFVNFLNTYLMFSAAYSAAMDVILALMPWKLVWKLQMKRAEKIGIALAMSMGIFAGITSILKIVQIPQMKAGDTYDGVPLTILANAESAVTIMAASVPALRSLIQARHLRAPPSYSPQRQVQRDAIPTEDQETAGDGSALTSMTFFLRPFRFESSFRRSEALSVRESESKRGFESKAKDPEDFDFDDLHESHA